MNIGVSSTAADSNFRTSINSTSQSELSFLSFLNQEASVQTMSDQRSSYIKVGDMTYRATSESKSFELSKKSERVRSLDEKPVQNTQSEYRQDGDSNSGNIDERGVHPGILVNIQPMDDSIFMATLPQSLRSFIQETVTVIRQIKSSERDLYIFKFNTIDLNVMIQQVDDSLLIQVQSGEKSLMQDFSRPENLEKLYQILQARFPDLLIEIQIVDEDIFASTLQQDSGSDRQQSDEQEEKEQDNEAI